MFFTGAAMQKIACNTLERTETSAFFQTFEAEVNEEMADRLGFVPATPWTLDSMLEQCGSNASAYAVFQLENVYDVNDLTDWQEDYDVDGAVDAAAAAVGVAFTAIAAGAGIEDSAVGDLNGVAGSYDDLNTNLLAPYAAFEMSSAFEEDALVNFEEEFGKAESFASENGNFLFNEFSDVNILLSSAHGESETFTDAADTAKTGKNCNKTSRHFFHENRSIQN